jgi:hypothetical protein
VPTEGLYAEALRRPGLVEALQREHKVMLAGPTTLLATLNSLQMGFRTLALERRSAEVWQVLGAVKAEFGKFGDVLAKTKKKLDEASNTIVQAETVRGLCGSLGVEALPSARGNCCRWLEDKRSIRKAIPPVPEQLGPERDPAARARHPTQNLMPVGEVVAASRGTVVGRRGHGRTHLGLLGLARHQRRDAVPITRWKARPRG